NSWSLIVQPAGSPTTRPAPAASGLVGLHPHSTTFRDDVSLSATPMVAGKNRTAPEASAALAAPVAASGSGNANLAALAIQTGLGSHDQLVTQPGINLLIQEIGMLQPGTLAHTFLMLQRQAALGPLGELLHPNWLD